MSTRAAHDGAGGVADPTTHRAAGVALRFTETMTGHVALGETDPERGRVLGRAEGSTLTFRLTIGTEDVARFVADPAHPATATGWVEAEALGGRFPVERGEFHLFVEEGAGLRTMRYRLWFTDAAGHALTLRGHKRVLDDPGADVWADTTTLYAQLLLGHVPATPGDPTGRGEDATVTGAGILRIEPVAFARQMTTFRTSGGSWAGQAAALAAFGRLFLGSLWSTYAARAVARVRRTPQGTR